MVSDWQRAVDALESIGPPVAYVGFSMGSIFGIPTVASLSSITAAVFVVGGIPSGGGVNDESLGSTLVDAASELEEPWVLMLNKANDEILPVEGTQAVFEAIPGERKQLEFWPGDHDDWSSDLIDRSVDFLVEHVTR